MGGDPHGPPVAAVEILEVAAPPRRLVEAIARALSRRVGVACRIAAPRSVEIPHIAGRGQADADRLLERIEALTTAAGPVIVALTAEDIAHPIFTHFFGRARHAGRAAVVSVARLDPAFYGMPDDEARLVRRAVREILHEMGHLAGLGHCEDWGCLMRFSSTVEGIDNRGSRFCASCSSRLADPWRDVFR